MSVLAAIRPDSVNLPLFLHVLGAMLLVGAGMMVALVFGVWLAIDVDGYELWDGWILASLILWAFAGAMGARGGQAFEKDPVGGRAAGIRYQAITSLAILAILLLMIWKPGA